MTPIIKVERISKRFRIQPCEARSVRYETLRESLVRAVRSPFSRKQRNGTRDDTVWALKDVSFDVMPGEVMGIIGSNGAGKSTTLRAVSGLIKPAGGQILLRGQNINKASPSDIVSMGVVHCPEGRRIFTRMTVRENLLLGHYTRRNEGDLDEALERVFTLFPILRERQTQLGGTMSGGQQQMLAIGRALMVTPQILLLDEPSLGLAPLLVQQIFNVIVEINKRGTTVLLVEQNANLALRIATRAYVLSAGKIELQGTGEELLANDSVRKAYLGEM
jgi:branched-chain amino acid transport system ATP-binding protein